MPMETLNQEPPHQNKVHKILAHSYGIYFFFFLLGVYLDLIFQFKVFTSSTVLFLGPPLLIFGTFLVFWAQYTSRNLKKENISKKAFCRGPYCYTRSPTHWGLFFLTLGFGIIINAVFVVLTTLLSFLITRLIFLNKQERVLEEKYGNHYLEYKKQVRL